MSHSAGRVPGETDRLRTVRDELRAQGSDKNHTNFWTSQCSRSELNANLKKGSPELYEFR